MKHIWNIKLHSQDQWFPNGGPNVCFQTNNSTQFLQTAKKCIRFKTSQNCVTHRKFLFLHDLKSEFEAQFTDFDKIGYVIQDASIEQLVSYKAEWWVNQQSGISCQFNQADQQMKMIDKCRKIFHASCSKNSECSKIFQIEKMSLCLYEHTLF